MGGDEFVFGEQEKETTRPMSAQERLAQGKLKGLSAELLEAKKNLLEQVKKEEAKATRASKYLERAALRSPNGQLTQRITLELVKLLQGPGLDPTEASRRFGVLPDEISKIAQRHWSLEDLAQLEKEVAA